MGVLRQLHPKAGDLSTTWDISKPATVDAASRVYDKLMSEGYRAYADLGNGREVLTAVHPEADEMVAFRPYVAG
jgi:hypothetical protein